MRFAERRARLGAGRADGDERLGLAPSTVSGGGRTLEPFPGLGGVGPKLGLRLTAGALVLRLGQGEPTVGVRCDRGGVGGGAASSGRSACAARASQRSGGLVVAACAGERSQLGLGAESLGAEPDANLGGVIRARHRQSVADGLVGVGPPVLPQRQLAR